jgi:drug/metabolite transporter (DMT)-like permease
MRAMSPSHPAAVALLRANRRGIQFMVGGMACFLINDALVKYASQTLPAAQLIFVRGLMATLLVLLAAQAMGLLGRAARAARGWVLVRAGIDACATILYLVSLFHLPLPNVTAINLASPLFIVAFAAPFLGERVDARRWLGVTIGFVGVLLVIQPRAEAFNAFSLVALAATMLHAIRDLVTRRIGLAVPAVLVTLVTAVVVTALAGLLSIVEGWQALGMRDLVLLGLAAVFLAGGYHLMIRATQAGELSVIAPFRYTALLWALLLGYIVWGDVPNLLAWGGIALLIGAGLDTIRRDRNRASSPPP